MGLKFPSQKCHYGLYNMLKSKDMLIHFWAKILRSSGTINPLTFQSTDFCLSINRLVLLHARTGEMRARLSLYVKMSVNTLSNTHSCPHTAASSPGMPRMCIVSLLSMCLGCAWSQTLNTFISNCSSRIKEVWTPILPGGYDYIVPDIFKASLEFCCGVRLAFLTISRE